MVSILSRVIAASHGRGNRLADPPPIGDLLRPGPVGQSLRAGVANGEHPGLVRRHPARTGRMRDALRRLRTMGAKGGPDQGDCAKL